MISDAKNTHLNHIQINIPYSNKYTYVNSATRLVGKAYTSYNNNK